jgi:hypothetical protein
MKLHVSILFIAILWLVGHADTTAIPTPVDSMASVSAIDSAGTQAPGSDSTHAADTASLAADSADTGTETAAIDSTGVPAADSVAEAAEETATADSAVVTETIGQKPAGDTAMPPAEEEEQKPPPRLTAKQLKQLEPTLARKRKGAIAGMSLYGAAMLIDYGLVVPKERSLGVEDIEDSFALLSPQLLVFGLRVAGPPMACMRATEVADAYERITGVEAPKNRSWTIYFCGWGLYAAGMFMPYLELIPDTEARWDNVALGLNIGADLVWAFTAGYAFSYIRKMRDYTDDTQEPRVLLTPSATSNGTPGVALMLRF